MSIDIIPWGGEKISKPGAYAMHIEDYHSDCCDGPSISSSGLRTLDSESPYVYWSYSYLNPDRFPPEENANFDFGKAAHLLLLGEEGFNEQFVTQPEEIDGKPWQGNRTVCKLWKDDQRQQRKLILTAKEINNLVGMSKVLAQDPIVQEGLLNGEIERSLIWKDKETGIWLKARPDCMPVDSTLVVDLKSTASAHPLSARRSICDYGYHMQLALIGMGIKAITGRETPDDDYVLLFIEKNPPFSINIKPIDPTAIHYGRRQIRSALRKFADCIDKGEWPGYDDSGKPAKLLDYYVQRLSERELLDKDDPNYLADDYA